MVMTTSSTADLLSKIDLFSGLSGRQLKKLLGRAREVDHESGREIAHEGLGGSAFHLLLSGEVAVSIGGQEIDRLHTGDYFGEISMIDGKPRSATVIVTEDTRTLAIPHLLFNELCAEEPEFTHGLLKHLCARLRHAEAAGH
jgi:CRP/FNR family cyclic AMP-dependent transcriptional regulator